MPLVIWAGGSFFLAEASENEIVCGDCGCVNIICNSGRLTKPLTHAPCIYTMTPQTAIVNCFCGSVVEQRIRNAQAVGSNPTRSLYY